MLKWNPQDLASRTRIAVKTIEMFERNQQRLTKPENDEIIKAFHKYHIDFKPPAEVFFIAGTGAAGNAEAPTATAAEDKAPIRVTLADGITTVTLRRQSDWGETVPGGQ